LALIVPLRSKCLPRKGHEAPPAPPPPVDRLPRRLRCLWGIITLIVEKGAVAKPHADLPLPWAARARAPSAAKPRRRPHRTRCPLGLTRSPLPPGHARH